MCSGHLHHEPEIGHAVSNCLLKNMKPTSYQIWEAGSPKWVEKSSQLTVSHLFNPESFLSHHMLGSSPQIPDFNTGLTSSVLQGFPENRPKLHQIHLHSRRVIENPSCIIQNWAKCNSEKVSLHVLWGCLTPQFLSLRTFWTNHS